MNSINKMKIFGLNYFKFIFLFHIFIVFGLLLYIGIRRNKMNKNFYNILGLLGIIIIIYHIYRLYSNGLHDKFWNYFHIFVIGLIFIYLMIYKQKSKKIVYDIILMLSFSALGLNLYFLQTH